ncbi:MAG: type II CAAX endopeptidase family protein [Acidobacteriota bacterium]
MTPLITSCPRCGLSFEALDGMGCPGCTEVAGSQYPPTVRAPDPSHLGMAFLVWAASVGAMLAFQLVALLIYFGIKVLLTGTRPELQLTAGLALITLGGTVAGHLVTLAFCWWVVTVGGQRPFFATLGWRWHHQFRWVHAVALAMGMLLLAIALERVLPHGETDFERLLQLSTSVRIAIALIAVLSAPLVEEVVYRGVLYSALAKARGAKFGVIVVTILFALVHAPQYWGSPAAIVAIISLSLVLTLVRAGTGQLLPCVATHFVFNGVQAITLLVSPPTRSDAVTTAVSYALGRAIGLDY